MKKRKTQKPVTITNGPWKVDADGAVLHNGVFITTLRHIPATHWRSILTVASITFRYGSNLRVAQIRDALGITVED